MSIESPDRIPTGSLDPSVFLPLPRQAEAERRQGTATSEEIAKFISESLPLSGMPVVNDRRWRDRSLQQTGQLQETFSDQRQDKYQHVSYYETEVPSLAHKAWQIHAEGYRAMNFVQDSAITPEGYLSEDIDKSRGEYTQYYLAYDPENPDDIATLRKIGVAPGEGYAELPAYKLCEDVLSAEGRQVLMSETAKGKVFKEIGALARGAKASPMGPHELFRAAVQDALQSNEYWIISTVSTTFESLVKSFGSMNFIVIGEDVMIDDPRVNPNILLRPAAVDPTKFLSNILKDIDSTLEIAARTRLQRSLLFMTEGLSVEQMGHEVAAARTGLLAK